MSELSKEHHVLTGRILADQKEFALFETQSGRVHRLSGPARGLCERALHYDMNLTQALNTLDVEQKIKDALSASLQKCEIFGSPLKNSIRRKILRGRIELPIFREAWVQWACSMIHRQRFLFLGFLLIGSIMGATYWTAQGGSLSMGREGVSGSVVFLFFLLNTLVHELGHAYALHHQGQKPGVIGFKIHGPMLAAYTDVNRAWMLEPRGRAVVSAAGLMVQWPMTFILAGLLTARYGVETADFFFSLTLITIAFMALPIRENDGDWVLKDLIAGARNNLFKSALTWLRHVFTVIGFGFFAVVLFRAWSMILPTLIEKLIQANGIDGMTVLLILLTVFIFLGTLSFTGMVLRVGRGVLETLKKTKTAAEPA
ncbi:MAG: hypothetical protein QNK37_09530 [Acidobacteriota bacterium]|nr:hypothetical protein [Acidobacteriota bacterium]